MAVTYANKFDFYQDGGVCYLQLHALRAPVGGYKVKFQDNDEYGWAVRFVVEDFEADNKVSIFQLGRSGRHICIEDTPANRRRYTRLQKAAIAAANAMWADMRTKGAR